MIVFNIKSLLEKKSKSENKRLTYKDIELATGIKYFKISRISSQTNYNLNVIDIEKLCRYFNCTPNDLISIYDEPKAFTPNS